MRPSLLQEITLYRYRYAVGYGLVVLLVLALLSIDISSIPYGLSDDEMKSAVISNSFNPLAPSATDVINLPYHLLQKASISLFGLSAFSVRLPSILLGLLAVITLGVTLNLWFRKNIAAMSLLIAASSAPFIAMARSGTASVLYMLLLLLLMLSAALLTSHKRNTFVWKIMVLVAGILLLYMPLGLYAVIALLLAGIFHPHVRYQFKRTRWWQFLSLGVLGVILIAPIGIAVFKDAGTLRSLFGLFGPSTPLTLDGVATSALVLAKSMLSFHSPQVTDNISPYFSLPLVLLVVFGLSRTIIDRHAARSYLLHIWLLVSLPLLILNPNNFPLLFVPAMFLMAIGIETFLREWYEVFPRNPYARIGGLAPVALIVIGLIAIGMSRYFYGYTYSDTKKNFHPEISAVRDVIKPQVTTELVVPSDQLAFYDILRREYPLLSVVTPERASSKQSTIVLANTKYRPDKQIEKIVTSYYSVDPVLLRTYRTQ